MEKADVAGRPVHRTLEVLTGAFTWVLITAPIWGAVLAPAKWAWFATAFSLYWLYKSFSVAVAATLAYGRLRAGQARDWLAEVRRRPGWRGVHHLVVFPTYNEPVSVLIESLGHLLAQDYPADRITLIRYPDLGLQFGLVNQPSNPTIHNRIFQIGIFTPGDLPPLRRPSS